MRIFVTGSEGYIGAVLMGMLIQEGFEPVGLDTGYFEGCLLYPLSRSYPLVRKDVRAVERADLEGCDAVIHLAALSNDPMGEIDPKLTEAINYKASVRLAEMAKEAGASRFLFASSCSLYGIATSKALDEEAPFNPVTAYARSKVNTERALQEMAEETFSPVYFRNATAYGLSPMMRFDIVLNNLVGWAVTTGEVRIMSDGTPWRPIVHVEDICSAMIAGLRTPAEVIHNEAFNIGLNEENYQIRHMGDMVESMVPGSKVTYTGEHGSDSRTYNVCFDKVKRNLTAFQPRWSMENGVRQLVEGYREHRLDFEMFQSRKYTRLKQLKYLQDRQELNDGLFWADP